MYGERGWVDYQTNARPCADSMLVQRLRRWPNIESAQGQHLVLGGGGELDPGL